MTDFARLEVHESDHWVWQVHENQSYIGRLVFRLKRNLDLSCAHCTEVEWSSLRFEFLRYERFMESLFSPDRFNYGQLGNVYPQLHFHGVPRYRESRCWGSCRFVDSRWGRNWSPSPASPLSLPQTYDFAAWFRQKLEEFLVSEVRNKSVTAR